MLQTEDFDYKVPPELIAQIPVTPRDSSRLLVFHRKTGEIQHRVFRDLPEYLSKGDALVVNKSRVIPARLLLDDGRVLLLLRRKEGRWEALSEGGEFHAGDKFCVQGVLNGRIEEELGIAGPNGETMLDVGLEDEHLIYKVGKLPLPPYIRNYKGDEERYQTVYAIEEGSAAAPTAGLHFTPELLRQVREMGTDVVTVTLHVSVDTFLPIAEKDAREHKIYREYIHVSEEAAETLCRARAITCIGTTSTRTIEQMFLWKKRIAACEGFADIYILPGHKFHFDSLVTNFHYPCSTNLLLTTAFTGSWELLQKAYDTAVRERYRFFSFGDAMLIR